MEQEYFKEFQTKNGNTLFLFWRWNQCSLKRKKKNTDLVGLTFYVEEAKFISDQEIWLLKTSKKYLFLIFHLVVFMNCRELIAELCSAVLNVLLQPSV